MCSSSSSSSSRSSNSLGVRPADQCGDYRRLLVAMDDALARWLAIADASERGLTEWRVARAVCAALPPGTGLYLGNSMPIRDVDMFALGPMRGTRAGGSRVPVGSNRGASGIDGLVSSASGFAAGLGRPVFLLVGDVSFLHDANGLLLLRDRPGQPPVTVVVVNNSGGGIFGFLPVAGEIAPGELRRLFFTPPGVDIPSLCAAHKLRHVAVESAADLRSELGHAFTAPFEGHSIVEVRVEPSGSGNVAQHRALEQGLRRESRRAVWALLHSTAVSADGLVVESARMERYQLPLRRALTTGSGAMMREGCLLEVKLSCGAVGVGEAAPLPGLHRETLAEATAQLAVVAELLRGLQSSSPLPRGAALLGGSLSAWLDRALGLRAEHLLPSVRFAVESAVLAALADAAGMSVSRLLSCGERACEEVVSTGVCLNGLVPAGDDAVERAVALVEEGYTSLKLKVGRQGDEGAAADAQRVRDVRAAVGGDVQLRCDANRAFGLGAAVEFGLAIADCGVEYVEEPCADPQHLESFFEQTGVPVALDESVDDGTFSTAAAAAEGEDEDEAGETAAVLLLPPSAGIAAVVLKPSVVGGLERAAALAHAARAQGARAVVSSAFESSVGLAACAALAAMLDAEQASGVEEEGSMLRTAHGLGTHEFFEYGADTVPARAAVAPSAGSLPPPQTAEAAMHIAREERRNGSGEASLHDKIGASFEWAWSTVEVSTAEEGVSYSLRCISEAGAPPLEDDPRPRALLLHGFLGGPEDWQPVMAGLAPEVRVVALELPGHGESRKLNGGPDSMRMEAVAAAVAAAVDALELGPCAVVGYSLGARVALFLALRYPDLFTRGAIVSGSPGLNRKSERIARAAQDASLAEALRAEGLERFLSTWYRQGLFAALRRHPSFGALRARRARDGDAAELAEALEALSSGAQPPLWDDLRALEGGGGGARLLFAAGERDPKFVALAGAMRSAAGDAAAEVALVPSAGHALHIEKPSALALLLHRFLLQ